MNQNFNKDGMKTQLCMLQEPANCEHKIDGRMSHTTLCGCNSLSECFKQCPYKHPAALVFISADPVGTDITYREALKQYVKRAESEVSDKSLEAALNQLPRSVISSGLRYLLFISKFDKDWHVSYVHLWTDMTANVMKQSSISLPRALYSTAHASTIVTASDNSLSIAATKCMEILKEQEIELDTDEGESK